MCCLGTYSWEKAFPSAVVRGQVPAGEGPGAPGWGRAALGGNRECKRSPPGVCVGARTQHPPPQGATPGHLGPPGRLAGRGGGGGGGSVSPGVLPMGKSLMGLLRGRTAGRGKKGLGAPWAVEQQRSPSGREAAVCDRIAPGPRQKGFNRASPDPFLPVGVRRPGGRAGAGLPACGQLVVSQGS